MRLARSIAPFALLLLWNAAADAAPPPLVPCIGSVALTPERAVHYRRISGLRFSADGTALVGVVSEQSGGTLVSHVWMLKTNAPTFHQVTFSPKSERSPEWSPDAHSLAFLSDRTGSLQLYVMPIDGGEARSLTAAEPVRDFHWSPDGQFIAYLAKEPALPAAEKTAGDAVVADRGDDLARLWMVDVASGKTRQVTSGPWRIDEFAWLDAARLIAVATDQPRVESWNTALYTISAAGGSFTEWGRPNQPFGGLSLSPDRKTVAVLASRDHGPIPHDLYLRDVGGSAWRNATAALDRVVKEIKWPNDGTPVLRVFEGFRSALYRASAGTPTALNLPFSVAAFDISRDDTLAFSAIGFKRLPELYLQRRGGSARQVSHLQTAWSEMCLADAEIFKFKSFDGMDIEAALMKPPLTKSGSKQPLVLLVHGGPASSFTADYFWFNAWAQLLVAHGFEVLMVNPRGSVGYGEAFVKANRADLGGGDFKDLMAALDAVLARGEVDPTRLGIGGWSYGAEMSVRATTQTDRFKAAVVGGAVFDEAAEFGTEDDSASDEWYFGTPWENADVYARNSPSTYIKHARTPMLIVHGANDPTNPVGQSQALYRALKHYGVEAEFVTYPREAHLPREERHQIDIMQRMLDWFERHLN